MLSGFVIAYSYEHRLTSGMSWSRFMGLRVIRLYPLYAVGLALGTVALIGHQLHSPTGTIDWPVLSQALLSAVLMLPNWGMPAIMGPRWSLTYELVANAGYAALARRLTQPLLWSIVAVAGVALVVLVTRTGTIDTGWEYWQAPTALARVTFSFGCGVLLFRLHTGVAARPWAVAVAMLVVALSLLTVALLGRSSLTVKLMLVFLGFPALTAIAAAVDVRGRAVALCGILGTTSYALYVIHQPAALLYEAVLKRLLGPDVPLAPWTGWLLLALLVAAAWLLDRVYDTPVRRRLVAAFTGSERTRPPLAAQ